MPASEIKGNEVESGKQPERELRTPSEQDKSKLQPNVNSEQKTDAPKDGGSSNRRTNSEHPKLEPSDSSQNSDHHPDSGEKRNEHPKLNEPSENNTTKSTPEAEKKPASEAAEKTSTPEAEKKPTSEPVEKTSTPEAEKKPASEPAEKTSIPEAEKKPTSEPAEKTSTPEAEKKPVSEPVEKTSTPEAEKKPASEPADKTSTPEAEKKAPAVNNKEANLSETGKEGAESKGGGIKPSESIDSGKDKSDRNAEHTETEDPDYKNRYDKTPTNYGRWEDEDGTPGQRGESTFIPEDPEVQNTLQDYGVDGIKYNDCYPGFRPVSEFDHYLEPDDYLKGDQAQFRKCNKALAEEVLPNPETGEVKNPELAARFTPDQLADIKAGDNPYGYTWHHDVDPGHMQLVPMDVHQACRHSGGRSLWGGGADYR